MLDTRTRVGILRGGIGKDYEYSLEKGKEIISHLFENLNDKYKTVDILIDKEGVWHLNGFPIEPAELIHKVDVVWDTSKNSDFLLTLNNFSLPSIGNELFFGFLKNSNEMLRKHMKSAGVLMPRTILIPVYQKDFDGELDNFVANKAKEVLHKFPAPWVVKSFTPDTNMGIHLAKTFPELLEAIKDGVLHGKSILVEEFITGKVASVHSLPSFRNQDLYVFPIKNSFGQLSEDEKNNLSSLVKKMHDHLGAKHYLKSDFVINRRGKVYLLGVDGTPDFKKDSHFSQICESIGAKMHHVIDHILEQATHKG